MKKILLFLAAAALVSCSNDDNNSNVPTPTATATTYVKGTMGTTAFDYSYYLNSPMSVYAYGYTNGFSGDGFTRYYYYGGSFSPVSDFDKNLSISFENMFSGQESEESTEFYNTFETVPTNYITSLQDDAHLKGVEVDYSSDADTFYSTKFGGQSGSSFTVVSATEGIEPGGSLKILTLVGTMTCKLYNYMEPSDVISISNAQYKIVLREYN